MTITVIVADDHDRVRDGLCALLSSMHGMQVVGEAVNGREAVEQVTKFCPAVAVLDIVMPELNGIDAAVQIREKCPTTKIIIVTMHASSEYIAQAFQAGALGYVLKESAANQLGEAVRTVAAGQRYLNPNLTGAEAGMNSAP